jgi:predicted ATPase
MAITIRIRNVGPVKEAGFDLNKINVFMGEQSCGKSTVAKIISYCTWIEKDVATSQSLAIYQRRDNYFVDRLETFHKLKGYFKKEGRYISYKSDVIEIEYTAKDFSIEWNDRYAYQRSKISYIPSERNMLILPDIENVELGNTNMRSFLWDWQDARKNYLESGKMPILNLGVEYYYDENSGEDHITQIDNGDSYDILLSDASSGLQSVTPLVSMTDYLTHFFYSSEERISSVLDERRRRTNQILMEELILKKYFGKARKNIEDEIEEINKKIRLNDKHVKELFAEWKRIEECLFSTNNTQFIIEEPEQNLSPSTQRDLAYYLVQKCSDNQRNHRLTMTTHSPYVLDALNCKSALIHPEEVSIYQIDNGYVLGKWGK